MTDKLTKDGWIEQHVEPGNCITNRWKREDAGLEAEITVTQQGEVTGVIRAAEDLAEVKRKGELLLKELGTPDQAADIMNRLMGALAADAPYRHQPQARASSSV